MKEEEFLPGTHTEFKSHIQLDGIAGRSEVVGKGKTLFEFVTTKGKVIRVVREANRVPGLPVDLVPLQAIMRTAKDGWFRINGESAQLVFANGNIVNVPFDASTNLPMLHSFEDATAAAQQLETCLHSCVTEEGNQNLSRAKKEMPRWHWRLGHPGMDLAKWLARRGLLGHASKRVGEVKDWDHPKCAGCNCGKQSRRPVLKRRQVQKPQVETDAKGTKSDQFGKSKAKKPEPGDCVAVDQFVVRQGGRLFTTSGREKEEDRFKGGTIFVDMATGEMFIRCQVSSGAEETLLAKACFEREAALNGVKVKHCHTDNGVFTSQAFVDEIHKSEQRLTFSGVGAHHQNGVAERAIGTVTRKARTQLLHAQLRWSDQTPVSLWPMSMQHAVWPQNAIPLMATGLSPDELFSRTTSNHHELQNLHPWGCPVHVPMPTLQDGMKSPKWQPRAQRGQFVGWSPLHTSSVALVRNLNTGRLSPQCHLVFDPWFETVHKNGTEPPEGWDLLMAHHQHEVELDEEDRLNRSLDADWPTKKELASTKSRSMSKQEGGESRNEEN